MKENNEDFISLDLLRKLFQEMREFEIKKLVVKNEDKTYEIERQIATDITESVQQESKKTDSETTNIKDDTEDSDHLFSVKTPFVGTFYRSASPDSEPFTDIGEKVQEGDTLCVIEAMKTMNEIEAEVSGVVKDILVSNGDPVEYDQTLFLIEEV